MTEDAAPEQDGQQPPMPQGPPVTALPGDPPIGIVPTGFKCVPYDLPRLVQNAEGQPIVVGVPHVILRFATPLGPLHFMWPAETVDQFISAPVHEAAQQAMKPKLIKPPGLLAPRDPTAN